MELINFLKHFFLYGAVPYFIIAFIFILIFGLIAKFLYDPLLGKTVLHYISHGTNGEIGELTWVGIIEGIEKADEKHGHTIKKQYKVRIIGRNDQYYDKDEPHPTEILLDCQLVHHRNGYEVVWD
jgi:hypothetical protein